MQENLAASIREDGDIEDDQLYLKYYSAQSSITHPGQMASLLDDLPTDLAELRDVAHNLVIHYRGQILLRMVCRKRG